MAWLVPNPTGDAWQPFCSGSSTRFSLKWIGTSSSSTTSCGCFEEKEVSELGGGAAGHSPGIGHPT